jgi:hypothetical protein
MPNVNGLLNSTVLDLGIGLIFVYLLLAIVCTAINEWFSGALGLRSSNLANAIRQLLDNQQGSGSAQSFLDQFYAHPLISGMMTPGNKHPAYLASRTFATAVMDLVANKQGTIAFSNLEEGINGLPPGDVKTALLALIQNADNSLQKAQKNIEQWFDDTMDRASGWYKSHSQKITIAIAVLLTVATNADTVKIARTLWQSPTVRATLVEKATSETASPQPVVEYPDKNAPLKPHRKVTKDELSKLQLVLGWSEEEWKASDEKAWLERVLGWILTIAAVSLGAPFWFGLLSKLVNIRDAGNKPKTSDEQDKSDKQATPKAA